MALLATVINLLFSNRGITEIAKLPSGNSITLETLIQPKSHGLAKSTGGGRLPLSSINNLSFSDETRYKTGMSELDKMCIRDRLIRPEVRRWAYTGLLYRSRCICLQT